MKKEDILYQPIKHVYFDEIIVGSKNVEYRDIKEGITANRYLQKGEGGKYILNPETTEVGKDYFLDDYNNGQIPFMPKQYKYRALTVGYTKDRNTAIVEVTEYSFEPHVIRANLYAFWMIVYHLGKVVKVHRK